MAKAKVTRKWLNENYPCISVGYCGLARLLLNTSADYYTCGVNGWNCDAYNLSVDGHNVCITTGYRGMIDNFDNNNSYDLYKKYDDMAGTLLANYDMPWKEQQEKLQNLLDSYLREVTEQ